MLKKYNLTLGRCDKNEEIQPGIQGIRSAQDDAAGDIPIMKLSEESGVSYVTLAKWRDEVRGGGKASPGNGEQPERWNFEGKFLIVLETHALNEAELGEHCPFKGILPAEIEE